MGRKKKNENSAWNLYLDKVERFAYWEKVFTKEECEKIIKIAQKKGLIQGLTLSKKSKIRASEISWL